MYKYEDVLLDSINYFNGDDLAAKVWVDKYCLKDNKGNIYEKNPADMHRRIAKEFGRIQKQKYKTPLLNEEDIFNLLDKFKYIIPQGSPMFGIGNNFQTISLSNCYLLDVPLDSYSSIVQVDEELVNISKRRGGVGIDLSNLRPKGTATNNAAKTSTGITTWMERYSNSIREVGQNNRRGALMLTLSIHHPDVMEFITIKNDDTKVTGANISVRLTKEFLDAVENDEEYELRFPVESKTPTISKMVKAKSVWNAIIHSAWLRAEPGLLMWDNVTGNTPADCYDTYSSKGTNPSLKAGTLILTDKGPRKIEDLQDKDFNVINLYNKKSKASCKLSGKNKVLYEVKLNSGFSYFATKEHRWATNNGEKTTLELLNGDRLPILKRDSVFNGKLGDFNDGFLIGWLIGDGWISTRKDSGRKQYGFICSEQDNKNAVTTVIEDILKDKDLSQATFAERNHNDSIFYELNTVSKSLDDYFDKFYNPSKQNGISKELICNSSEDFVKGLINGILSSDGNICKKTGRITFTSKHKQLLLDLSEILGFYGIRTQIKYSKSKNISFPNGKNYNKEYERYDLVINDIDSKKHFAKLFTSIILEKKDLLNYISKLSTKSKNINYNIVQSVNLTNLRENVWDITVFDNDNCFSLSHCITHNCSEINLSPLDSCRLLCLNLLSYVENPFSSNAYFNFEKFHKHSYFAQHLMDDLVDLEAEKIDAIINKVNKDPEPDYVKSREIDLWKKIKKFNNEGRRTGTGITALGDTLAAVGLSYGSEESIKLTEEIYRTLKLACYEASVDMAKELGSFVGYSSDAEKDCPYIQRIKKEAPTLYDKMVKYGRRNVALLTTAPTGTVSILTQTTSGIEPLFMIGYTRRTKINHNNENIRVDFVDKNGDSWQEYTVYHHQVKRWMEITGQTDIKNSPWYNSCAEDINWVNRVKLQAAAQNHVCHAISSTINLPENVAEEEVAKIYQTAFKSGCKGITIYRKNCRTGVLVDTSTKKEVFVKHNAPKRPRKLKCNIHHLVVKSVNYYVAVGLYENQPYEVFVGRNSNNEGESIIPRSRKSGFINKKKKGEYEILNDDGEIITTIYSAQCEEHEEALARMTSVALRHGADVHFITESLLKVRGEMNSFAKSIARALKVYIVDGTSTTDNCPTCEGIKLVYSEGCSTCKNCGYSKCH